MTLSDSIRYFNAWGYEQQKGTENVRTFTQTLECNEIKLIVNILCVCNTLRRLYFATAEVRFMFSLSFWNLGLAFNLEYLSHFFINFNIQCQFLNPHDEQIKNLSLIFEFDGEILEIIGNEKD